MGKPKDVSKKAISLARLIDRLPPGDHTIELSKGRDQIIISVKGDTVNYRTVVGGGSDGKTER